MSCFTIKEVSDLCDVKVETVRRWIENKRLIGYLIPESTERRVTKEALITFLWGAGMPIPESLSPPSQSFEQWWNDKTRAKGRDQLFTKDQVKILAQAAWNANELLSLSESNT